ncbi:hypothetical protein L3X38_024276 [Prunus dulcis]|uniref:Myb/SANT-like domain-containing protein n=1 Tax=Prunus dulcis TaxID=3755 RepID=A0AAD4VZL9_PRUDU|nr:hypothetical protein L3X38_024276 [Prunus dulcis]
MERSLADILREQLQIGHKGDGGWKAVAYNTAAAILSAQFDIEVSADNIRNRVKTWKRFYGTVSDILSQSGFNWDATKKMISVDEENVWDEATGEGAETCAEATEVMTSESDLNNIVDLESDPQGFESCQVDDVSPNSSCPKRRNQKPSDIPPPKKRDLSPDEQLKACSWFIENEKQFLILKTIPTERKKGMVLMFISPKA